MLLQVQQQKLQQLNQRILEQIHLKQKYLKILNLNGRGSNKETRHLELSLEGSGLTYEPGDSLGIYPENDPELVDILLKELKWDPEETCNG